MWRTRRVGHALESFLLCKILMIGDSILQAPLAEQPGPSNTREDSTPQQAELPVVSATTARGSLTGSDADKILFLRTRLEDTERRLKAMEAEAAIAKSKLKQSVAREAFYVQEMGRASRELLCKHFAQPPSACM